MVKLFHINANPFQHLLYLFIVLKCAIFVLGLAPTEIQTISEHLPQQYPLINGLFYNYFVFQMDFAIC